MTSTALYRLAANYFNDLARAFPVMCASDEFHFMPRIQSARDRYHQLDRMDRIALSTAVKTLKQYRSQFRRLGAQIEDLEERIDATLLVGSVNGLLAELDQIRSWRCNPLLYLKIALIGLDHAWHKPAASEAERRERMRNRLDRIPGLFDSAVENLIGIPEPYQRAALAMTRDGGRYLTQWLKALPGKTRRRFEAPVQIALKTLAAWARYLEGARKQPLRAGAAMGFETTLAEVLLSRRSPDEVFAIAQDDWRRNFHALERLQRRIDPKKSWSRLYHDYRPGAREQTETLSLYRNEYDALTAFFARKAFFGMQQLGAMEIVRTPLYLQSVRSSASFAAAFSDDRREVSHFYISPQLKGSGDKRKQQRLSLRLNREYRFLCAHETVPGHHLLDSIRRNLSNPVRRQIESALFYEGWAYYAETLLPAYGYVSRPLDLLVDHKRRLWRAARCQIDTGLSTGRLSVEKAVDLLMRTGFDSHEALRQIRRFQLNPGYQVCYTLGRFEIEQLKRQWAPKIGERNFHIQLLEGGQLPFHLAGRRFHQKTET